MDNLITKPINVELAERCSVQVRCGYCHGAGYVELSQAGEVRKVFCPSCAGKSQAGIAGCGASLLTK